MLFACSTGIQEIEFKKASDCTLAVSGGKLYLYGKIFFLYEDDGLTPVDYSEERLAAIIDKHKENASLFIEGSFFIMLDVDGRQIFFSDFFGRYRAYCTFSAGVLFISESVDELVEINPEVNPFEEQVYAKKGYTGRHFTTYEKIYRVIGGQYFTVTPQGITVSLVFVPGRVGLGAGTYPEFEKIVDSTFPYFFSKDKRNVIEFSGGVDSSFLALYAKLKGYDIELVTGRLRNPSLDQNKYDVARSLQKSFDLNVPLGCIDVDLANLGDTTEARHAVVKSMMPFEKHFGKLHIKLVTALEGRQDEIIAINGQNADSIVCLGPSEKINLSLSLRGVLSGGKGLLSRLLLSKYYCAVVGKRSGTSVTAIHQFFIKDGVRLPLNRESYLLVNMFFSKGYLPVLTGKVAIEPEFTDYLYRNYCEPYKGFGVGEVLYISKLQNFMHGGDHRIVLCSHAVSGVDVALPFTTIALFRFFAGCDRSVDYVLRGKGFLEDFLKKNMRNFEKTVAPRDLKI